MKYTYPVAVLLVTCAFLISSVPSASANFSSKTDASSSSMVFPVAGKKARVGSFWGAVRDGGARKHEGIDIFAPRHTPVVAVKAGIVTTVSNGGRGGKTVWLKSLTDGFTYYYAHLQKQTVKAGQYVKQGEVLGTVGNTGNAKLTPPHLHFGMYSFRGAVDPLPYVKGTPRLSITPVKENLAKSGLKPKASTPKVSPKPQQQLAQNRIDNKYIWKKLNVPADPKARYFVTIRSNVVRVTDERLQVVGRYEKQNNERFPYRIILGNNNRLNISKAGKVYTSKGILVGEIS